ncbi:MAG: hypothetical protein AB1714_05290 [Acidobacteriota bacterium]
MTPVRIDLNNPEFQADLFALQKEEQFEILGTLKKISKMSWEQVYRDPGLRWEACLSRKGPHGERLYTFRITRKLRALAYRQEDWLRILSLHPDHDSAYGR